MKQAAWGGDVSAMYCFTVRWFSVVSFQFSVRETLSHFTLCVEVSIRRSLSRMEMHSDQIKTDGQMCPSYGLLNSTSSSLNFTTISGPFSAGARASELLRSWMACFFFSAAVF